LSAAGGWPSTTNGCGVPTRTEFETNDVDVYVMPFDKDADEHAQWSLVMPTDWDGGTLTARFYWTTASGSAAETVEWAIQGRSYADDDALDQAWGTKQSVNDTWIADGDVHITSISSAITLAGGPAASELVQFRVYRDVSEDNLGGDALLLGALLVYTRS